MRIRQQGIVFNKLETLYFGGLGVLVVFVEIVHPLMFRLPDGTLRLPFLPLLLLSIYCAGGLMYTWLLSYRQFKRKLSRIMSYAESPFIPPAETPAGVPAFSLNGQ